MQFDIHLTLFFVQNLMFLFSLTHQMPLNFRMEIIHVAINCETSEIVLLLS